MANKWMCLTNLYLDESETQLKIEEYQSYINEFYPNLEKINKRQYVDLKEMCFKGDENAKLKLQQYSFKIAIEELIYIYTHFDLKGYEFCDAVNDVCFKVSKCLDQYLKAGNLYIFNVFVRKNIMKELLAKLESRVKRNLDIYKEFRNHIKISTEDVEDEIAQIQLEENAEKNEMKENIELPLSILKAKQIKVVKLYFGIGETRPKTSSEIGEMYNVSGSNVNFVFVKGLRKLKHPMVKLMFENKFFDQEKE